MLVRFLDGDKQAVSENEYLAMKSNYENFSNNNDYYNIIIIITFILIIVNINFLGVYKKSTVHQIEKIPLLRLRETRACCDNFHKQAFCRDNLIQHNPKYRTTKQCSICKIPMHDGDCFDRCHFQLFNNTTLETPFIDANRNQVPL